MVGLLIPRLAARSSSEVAWNPRALNISTAAFNTASRFSMRSRSRSSRERKGDGLVSPRRAINPPPFRPRIHSKLLLMQYNEPKLLGIGSASCRERGGEKVEI